ncbi:MAG TPA: hypothetical protein VFV34_25975 [Blastocatellia bacterium]|nr:hypothetical protein [Blastocatellia bacterium]
MKVSNRARLDQLAFSVVAREVSSHHSLEAVLSWGSRPESNVLLPQVIGAVVTQDEFTHDVVVPWRDGLVVVYDAT